MVNISDKPHIRSPQFCLPAWSVEYIERTVRSAPHRQVRVYSCRKNAYLGAREIWKYHYRHLRQ